MLLIPHVDQVPHRRGTSPRVIHSAGEGDTRCALSGDSQVHGPLIREVESSMIGEGSDGCD